MVRASRAGQLALTASWLSMIDHKAKYANIAHIPLLTTNIRFERTECIDYNNGLGDTVRVCEPPWVCTYRAACAGRPAASRERELEPCADCRLGRPHCQRAHLPACWCATVPVRLAISSQYRPPLTRFHISDQQVMLICLPVGVQTPVHSGTLPIRQCHPCVCALCSSHAGQQMHEFWCIFSDV